MALRDRIAAATAALRGQALAPAVRDLRRVHANSAETFSDLSDPRLREYLRGGHVTNSGAVVNERTALGVATAWRCASILCGVTTTFPTSLVLREPGQSDMPAPDHPFKNVLAKPNDRQTPGEFTSMLMLHKLQRGNGYAMKITGRGRLIGLWPLDSNRMQVLEVLPSLELVYRYTQMNGQQVDFTPAEIMHLRGMSWDGKTGLSVVSFMAEAVGLSLQTNKAAAKLFLKGQFTTGYLSTDKPLSDNAYDRMIKDRDAHAGIDADDAQTMMILEEGLKFSAVSLSARDAQLIDIMGLSRDDIGMFYGVPPFLYGDTTKATSWGSGIEQQNLGFLQYTLQPHLTNWSETYKRDCLSGKTDDPRLAVDYDLDKFLEADSAGRSAYYARALGGGGQRPWMTQNEVRRAVGLPPRLEKWASQLPEIGTGRITETDNGTTPDPQQPAPAKP